MAEERMGESGLVSRSFVRTGWVRGAAGTQPHVAAWTWIEKELSIY